MTPKRTEAAGAARVDRVESRPSSSGEDAERQLGAVPEPPEEREGSPLVSEALIERYRDLASRLLFGGGDGERVVLAITSAASGEGVTTSCAAAALALARSTSKDILLLDANLRRPAAHRLFDSPEEPGFYQMAAEREGLSPRAGGRRPASAYVHPTRVANLWVSPAGGVCDDPTQLLTSNGAREAFHDLTAKYDYTVVDCPPVLSSVDAAALCRLATRVAIVVRAELTPRELAAKACERLGEGRLMGVLLNGVEE